MKNLLWLIILLTGTAQAQFYGVAGFGQSRMKEEPRDNSWHQTGFDHIAEEKSNAWKIGVGYKLTKNFSFEADYRDLGQFNQQALYVSDLGGPGSYDPKTQKCIGACQATSSSFQHGYTKGIGLSFVAAPDWTVAPFVRAGMFYHVSNFYTSQVYGGDPYQKQFARFTQNDESPNKESFKNSGFEPMYGVGVRAGFLEVEYTRYPKVGANLGPYRDAETIMLNVKVGF